MCALLWDLLIKPALVYACIMVIALDHGDRKIEFNLDVSCFVSGCETPVVLCVCHD